MGNSVKYREFFENVAPGLRKQIGDVDNFSGDKMPSLGVLAFRKAVQAGKITDVPDDIKRAVLKLNIKSEFAQKLTSHVETGTPYPNMRAIAATNQWPALNDQSGWPVLHRAMTIHGRLADPAYKDHYDHCNDCLHDGKQNPSKTQLESKAGLLEPILDRLVDERRTFENDHVTPFIFATSVATRIDLNNRLGSISLLEDPTPREQIVNEVVEKSLNENRPLKDKLDDYNAKIDVLTRDNNAVRADLASAAYLTMSGHSAVDPLMIAKELDAAELPTTKNDIEKTTLACVRLIKLAMKDKSSPHDDYVNSTRFEPKDVVQFKPDSYGFHLKLSRLNIHKNKKIDIRSVKKESDPVYIGSTGGDLRSSKFFGQVLKASDGRQFVVSLERSYGTTKSWAFRVFSADKLRDRSLP